MAAMLRGSESRAQATKEHEYQYTVRNTMRHGGIHLLQLTFPDILLATPTQFTQLAAHAPYHVSRVT